MNLSEQTYRIKQMMKLFSESDVKKVVCDNCDWSWNLSDGGKEPYLCHKCGNDNQINDYALNEQTDGIDEFITKTIETYPEVEPYSQIIKKFILNSNSKKIEVSNFKYPAAGLALHTGVLLNSNIFKTTLPYFLFVVFHEIAHQYQYKKYGDGKMYEFYNDKLSLEDAAKTMKQIELVADEFAMRKVREFIKLGLLNKGQEIRQGSYKNVPISHFEKLISQIKSQLKGKDVNDFDIIANLFYNMLKSDS